MLYVVLVLGIGIGFIFWPLKFWLEWKLHRREQIDIGHGPHTTLTHQTELCPHTGIPTLICSCYLHSKGFAIPDQTATTEVIRPS